MDPQLNNAVVDLCQSSTKMLDTLQPIVYMLVKEAMDEEKSASKARPRPRRVSRPDDDTIVRG